tara:strand:- start:109 stop:708 length:600 start_codon:yes stop_codon:yes gene_type:complete
MNLTHEEFQKARRISREIQNHLESTNSDGLRSTDLYPILARKKLIEKDKYNGIHFRRFLRKLKENDLLKLIPQCKFQYNQKKPEFLEWYFYQVKKEPELTENKEKIERKIILPKLPENEINELIEKAKPHIEKLPKKEIGKFSAPQLETRELYQRAYESWTEREVEIMTRAYKKFGRIDKVAELLKRQPNVIKKRLNIK